MPAWKTSPSRMILGLSAHALTVVLTLLIVSGLGWSQAPPPVQPGKADKAGPRIAESPERGLLDRVSLLEGSRPPVGTVMAFAGQWPPKQAGGDKRIWAEKDLGWLACDGRKFQDLYDKFGLHSTDLAELKAVLGHERLPNYSGYFLRGVGGDAKINPDGAERLDPWDHAKKPGDQAGSVQGFATARPKGEPFTTGDPKKKAEGSLADDGHHDHKDQRPGQGSGVENKPLVFDRLVANGKNVGGTMGSIDGKGMIPDTTGPGDEPVITDSMPLTPGFHHHEIGQGGDHETRPVNVAVYWIIKFR